MDSMHSTNNKTRKSGHSLTNSSYNISSGVQSGGRVVLTTVKVYISMVRFPAGRIRATEEPQRWQNRSGASSLFVFDYFIITNPHYHI